MILRPDYIKAVEPYIDAPLVKIFSGVRRCGKSTILKMDIDEKKKNNTKEIDFGGIRRDEKIYVQGCVELPTESTRETDNLTDIKDHYHKYVVCMDNLAIGNENGIEIVHIADSLLRNS